jgi:pyrophosphate--fructose-6-phosphate 1-phosphotransferase
VAPEIEIICYRHGYAGVLKRDFFVVDSGMRDVADRFFAFGGSAIGNSRVRLANAEDCARRGLVKAGEDPQVVAAENLAKDGVDVLHTIGGDDTNTVAAQLSALLSNGGYNMAVVGLPKTIDNDIMPIAQSLGAETAARETAHFFTHIVNECTTSPRMLIIHEIMGRNCGWLNVASAIRYRNWLSQQKFVAPAGLDSQRWDIHGVYIPEIEIDMQKEVERLRAVMERLGNVNLFVSEGACLGTILKELEREGQEVPRDAFGHVKLDIVNPGKWFGEKLASRICAEKILVQKSGYFARSAPPCDEDLRLIHAFVDLAVDAGLEKRSGVIGGDCELGGVLSCIAFDRICGGKAFNCSEPSCRKLFADIGQS